VYLIVIGIALLAGTGAMFGASNTLYASVQSRTAEIGTLRALGFKRLAILRAFLTEAVLVALVGFAIGGALAWSLAFAINTALSGVGFPMATFSTNVVTLRVSLADLGVSLALALGIGLLG